jgi:hypothetical protein
MQTPDSLPGLWRVPLEAGSVSPLEIGESARRFSISGSRLAYSRLAITALGVERIPRRIQAFSRGQQTGLSPAVLAGWSTRCIRFVENA